MIYNVDNLNIKELSYCIFFIFNDYLNKAKYYETKITYYFIYSIFNF